MLQAIPSRCHTAAAAAGRHLSDPCRPSWAQPAGCLCSWRQPCKCDRQGLTSAGITRHLVLCPPDSAVPAAEGKALLTGLLQACPSWQALGVRCRRFVARCARRTQSRPLARSRKPDCQLHDASTVPHAGPPCSVSSCSWACSRSPLPTAGLWRQSIHGAGASLAASGADHGTPVPAHCCPVAVHRPPAAADGADSSSCRDDCRLHEVSYLHRPACWCTVNSLAAVMGLNCWGGRQLPACWAFQRLSSFGKPAQVPPGVWHQRFVLTRKWQQACCSP